MAAAGPTASAGGVARVLAARRAPRVQQAAGQCVACRTFTVACGAVNSSQLSSTGYGTWTYSIAALRTPDARPNPGTITGPEQGRRAPGIGRSARGRQRSLR